MERRLGFASVVTGSLIIAAAILVRGTPAPASPPAPVVVAAPQVEASVVAQKTPYRGNTNSHKFHRSTCSYYDCPNCTAKFATREEAIAAGYRPCGTCRP